MRCLINAALEAGLEFWVLLLKIKVITGRLGGAVGRASDSWSWLRS